MLQDLVEGRVVASDALDALAPRYLIAVVSFAGATSDCSALVEAAGPGVLTARLDPGVVLLVPDFDAARTQRVVERLARCVGDRGWLATAGRPAAEVFQGFTEAADVLRLVAAGRRPCGAYTISDVLIEYAATRHARVVEKLVAVIKPLRAHAVLWETLTALVDADYSRHKAARRLYVHRTTVDYRLRRITELTGCDTASSRGLQILATALIAHAVNG